MKWPAYASEDHWSLITATMFSCTWSKNLSFPTWQDHMAKPRWVKVLCAEVVWHWKRVSESFSHWVTLEAWICLTSWLDKSPKWRFMVMFHDYLYKDWEKHKKKPIVVIESWYLLFGGSTFQFRKKKKKNSGRKVAKQRHPRFAAVHFGPKALKTSFISFIRCFLPRCMSALASLEWSAEDCFLKGRILTQQMVAAMEIYQGFYHIGQWKHIRSFCSTLSHRKALSRSGGLMPLCLVVNGPLKMICTP